MAGKHWYQVIDKEGNVIFEGMRKQICDRFCIDEHYFCQIRTHNYAFQNKYYIKDLGLKAHIQPSDMTLYKQQLAEQKAAQCRWNIQPKPEKKKTPFERVKWHLDIYGNTITYKNPKKIVEELEDLGYQLKITHEPKRVIRQKDCNQGEVFSECWIIQKLNK